MANYYCASRTNYFRVIDIEAFKEAMSKFSAGDSELYVWEKDGKVAFGGYGTITSFYDHDLEDMVEVFPILQEHMEEGEAVIIVEAGYEKLRYCTTFAWAVTKDSVKFYDAMEYAIKRARRITSKTAHELLAQY